VQAAESLTGRVDHVLLDTVQVVLDGDIMILSIGQAFEDAPEQPEGTNNISPLGNNLEINISEMTAPDNSNARVNGQSHLVLP
jgi:hypothetical protein